MVADVGVGPLFLLPRQACYRYTTSAMYLPSVPACFGEEKVCRPLPDIPLHEIVIGLIAFDLDSLPLAFIGAG